MRKNQILEQNTYWDGKQGVREVVHIAGGMVRYRVLAAKKTVSYKYGTGMMDVIGTESQVTLDYFAKWAKYRVNNTLCLLSELNNRNRKILRGMSEREADEKMLELERFLAKTNG